MADRKSFFGCTREEMSDALTSALEGGSNEWYLIVGKKKPKQMDFRGTPWSESEYIGDYPLNEGGALVLVRMDEVEELEENLGRRGAKWRAGDTHLKHREIIDSPDIKKHVLDLPALQRGCNLMREKYPEHYKDIKSGNGDAITGDVFLQLSLFGDVVFG